MITFLFRADTIRHAMALCDEIMTFTSFNISIRSCQIDLAWFGHTARIKNGRQLRIPNSLITHESEIVYLQIVFMST